MQVYSRSGRTRCAFKQPPPLCGVYRAVGEVLSSEVPVRELLHWLRLTSSDLCLHFSPLTRADSLTAASPKQPAYG